MDNNVLYATFSIAQRPDASRSLIHSSSQRGFGAFVDLRGVLSKGLCILEPKLFCFVWRDFSDGRGVSGASLDNACWGWKRLAVFGDCSKKVAKLLRLHCCWLDIKDAHFLMRDNQLGLCAVSFRSFEGVSQCNHQYQDGE